MRTVVEISPLCERCGAEGFTSAGDFADNGATLCTACGALWLATVVGLVDSSLPDFLAAADGDALAHHDTTDAAAEAHARAERAAQLNAARSSRRKGRGSRTAENRRLANAARNRDRVKAARKSSAQRAQDAARILEAGPMTVAELAAAMETSPRTAARAISDAKRAGLIGAQRPQHA